MLSYQHIYHAGNASDVHKHLWLLAVIDDLQRTNKPLCWIDTHAGRGLYDLSAPEAQKLSEYKSGITPLYDRLKNKGNLPPPLGLYFNLIEAHNKHDNMLRFYPGSALLAAQMLRPADRLLAYDMHRGEYPHLAQTLTPYKNSRTRQANGLEHLLKNLPPREKRGGVLIDPSYEIKTEYAVVAETVINALALWPSGIYMVWYPLLPAGHHQALLEPLQVLKTPVLIDEWTWRAPSEKGRGLYGSGMAILNTPPAVIPAMAALKALALSTR